MNIKQLLLTVVILTCVHGLSAMEKNNKNNKNKDILTHIGVVKIYNDGNLTVGETIPYLGQNYKVVRAGTNSEGSFLTYELAQPITFGLFHLGTTHVTGKDLLKNPSHSYNPLSTWTYNKAGCALLGTSLLTGTLVLMYGISKIRSLLK